LESKQNITDIAPGFLKDFLPFISPKLFEIINIPELTIKMSKMGFNYLFNKNTDKYSKNLLTYLPKRFDLLTLDSNFSSDSKISKKEYGESILEFYFSQINYGKVIFLDLRSERFNLGPEQIYFEPNGMWYQFSGGFREGLTQVYEGFYLEKEDIFEMGLEKIKLIDPHDNNEIKNEMKNLFKSHFGEALNSPIKFKMSDFQESFHQIFSFLYKQNKNLPSEFTFLGIYLVTLYLNLSSIEESLDVKASYLKAISKTF